MLGIDISFWNGQFSFAKAEQKGAELVYIKASQGVWMDKRFKENALNCTLPYKGAYHFLDYQNFPAGGELAWGAKQAQFFVNATQGLVNLTGMLDIEDNSGSGWKPLWSNLGSVTKICMGFKQEYKRLTGKEMGVYMSTGLTLAKQWTLTGYKYTWRNFVECPLWVANYNKGITVPATGAWSDYAIWQYSATGDGVAFGNGASNIYIDLNTVKNVNALLLDGTPPPLPEPPPDGSTKWIVTTPYGLNVRSAPSTTATKIGALPYNYEFFVTTVESGWGKLRDRDGYVSLAYAKQM